MTANDLRTLTVWGNHSASQVPDVRTPPLVWGVATSTSQRRLRTTRG